MKQDNSQVGFTLLGIKTEQFAIMEDIFNPKKEVGLTTELQFKLDQTNKQIGVFMGFEFMQSRKGFLKIVVSCHFKISEDSWETFLHTGENKLIVPKGFLAHLAMLTTGTSRGVLFAKTESTSFSKYIIPAINVAAMIPDDAVFDFIRD